MDLRWGASEGVAAGPGWPRPSTPEKNAAYSQNISVTVPANTRFYVVLQKVAVRTSPPAPARIAEPAAKPLEIPTAQELRELMDLRREINRMYQEPNGVPSGGTKP